MELKHDNVFLNNIQDNDINAEQRLSSFMRARKRSIIGNGFVMEKKDNNEVTLYIVDRKNSESSSVTTKVPYAPLHKLSAPIEAKEHFQLLKDLMNHGKNLVKESDESNENIKQS
uniref:Cytosolic protein n=1 Tax=Strongyloides venezuelensis TaxID=75913 RepID=A0A0K0FJN9_STRVS